MLTTRHLLTALMLAAATTPAMAAEHVVRMLNIGSDGTTMVFEPAFVQAEVGDTVRFVPETAGHYVRSLATPGGVSQWNSSEDQPYTVTLEQAGLYFYICPPHLMMGMIGLIQAGPHAANLPAVQASMQAQKGRMYSNSQRVDALLQQVKP